MVLSASPAIAIGEKRVTFHHLNWAAYQQILHALPESRAARLTYDRGILEITMPLADHEFATCLIELFTRILVFELGIKNKTMGSTTLAREELDRSPEPDNAYYIQNQPVVAGRNVDLTQDPPPLISLSKSILPTPISTSYGCMPPWVCQKFGAITARSGASTNCRASNTKKLNVAPPDWQSRRHHQA